MNKTSDGILRFLFLEFLEPEINGLLSGLRREFGSAEGGTDIHITVRGPYYEEIPGQDIEKWERIVKRDPILIHGVGVFQNALENVVYIRVRSDALKKIWMKPDFPIDRFGFNPHISLHKSEDLGLASAIFDFLNKEDLKLISHEFRLIPYSSRQRELFPFDSIPKERHFLELSNRRLVRPDILQRAANTVKKYRSINANAEIERIG